MKKILQFFTIILSLLLIAGCSSEQSKVFTKKEGSATTEITFYHKGDTITKHITKVNVVFTKEIGFTKDEINDRFSLIEQTYKKIDGATTSIELTDKEATQTIELDYTKIDLDKAKETNLLPLEIFNDDKKTASLSKTTQFLTSEGFEVKK